MPLKGQLTLILMLKILQIKPKVHILIIWRKKMWVFRALILVIWSFNVLSIIFAMFIRWNIQCLPQNMKVSAGWNGFLKHILNNKRRQTLNENPALLSVLLYFVIWIKKCTKPWRRKPQHLKCHMKPCTRQTHDKNKWVKKTKKHGI